MNDRGARHTAWPGALVVDASESAALIFYSKEDTEPTGAYSFMGVGTSIATWPSPGAPAARPPVRPELSDPTVSSWVADWHQAASVMDGAPLMSVHFSPYLGRFVAFYMVPLGSHMALRTAPRPEGPWSAELHFADAAPALDGNWDYALMAHPELERDGGRVEYVSYFQPGRFLDGTST
jgi:hypothetical protein